MTSSPETGNDARGNHNADLRAAIDAADLRVLLMALFHRTGDATWLRDPFTPQRDVRLVADPTAGLPPDVQAQIREAAVAEFSAPKSPAVADPGDELMHTMMQACLGERVGQEYSLLMREELGFTSHYAGIQRAGIQRAGIQRAGIQRAGIERTESARVDAPCQNIRVLIVGAGISGIALAAQLSRLGIEYSVIEKNDEVGGTWWENRYPGCGVDTPNHAYSFSHGTRPRWTRYFSLRDELQSYLEQCSAEFAIRDHIVFGTTVTSATWNESTAQWDVTTINQSGRTDVRSAHILVTAVGVLNTPKDPAIPGLRDFAGPLFHTARWPDNVDLTNKDVAVIGTGASAMQLVPSIASETSAHGKLRSLTVYQRSPQWARNIEGYRSEIGESSQWLFDHIPYYLEWFRFTMWWRYGDGLLRYLRRDPDWPFPERAMNKTNDRHRIEMTEFIQSELANRPDLLPKCMPTYPPYGKRILLDNGWFSTMCKPNVHLVTDPIANVEPSGMTTNTGERRDHDVVIIATGFETTQLAGRLNITGRNGAKLGDEWANENPRAYLGITVPKFPNLFGMLGPNTGLGHGGSTIFMSECQARYILSCITSIENNGWKAVEVRADVHDEYNYRVDAEHAELIWTHPGMNNWYKNRDGRITALLPWRLVDYWSMTHEPNWDDYLVT